MKTPHLLLALIASVCLASTAHAHGIWFAQRSGELAMIYGDGGKDDPIVPKFGKITLTTALDASGQPATSGLNKTEHLVLVDRRANPAVVAGTLDNGYYSQGSDGKWRPKGKSEMPGAKKSGQYIKLAIHQLRDLDRPLVPLSEHPLQIVPTQAKLPTRKGDTLTLRVWLNGKPAAGVKVTQDYLNDPEAKPVLTNREGLVSIKVPNHGLNVVLAKLEIPASAGIDADIVQYAASYSFTLLPSPD